MGSKDILQNPEEHLDDIGSMCSKVAHDIDQGRVAMTDLVSLRDMINAMRGHVANGGGYKTVPRIVKPSEED